MQFPESWLRSFCNPPLSTQALADLLTMSGMEVEELHPVAPPFTGVVVAEIVEVTPHPGADKLRVCRVNAGGDTTTAPLQIVCGAPNARVGIRVPLAVVGAVLPADASGKALHIGLGKLRGVDSAGMLCSASELGIAQDHSGLLELDASHAVGTDLRQALQLDDMIFVLKLTPNLAHCLSVFGIARELSALTGSPLLTPEMSSCQVQHAQQLAVDIQAPDLCGRFSGRIVQGVNPKAKAPTWMIERLARCGQRSVSALVDISNYVMFEYGRPSHIFDLDKIHGGLAVRWGRAGESLELLNGNTITLDDKVGVIADSQAVESVAGIMGGQATAVSDDTQNIYIEAAFWWPEAVAGRSRRFNFSTDAGHRFERGVDPSSTVEHIERITQLVLDVCGGKVGPIDDQTVNLPDAKPVAMRVARASKVIGAEFTQAQCSQIFQRLGFAMTDTPGVITVTPPPWRFDLRIEEDLIEEVIRVSGFDKLPSSPPRAPITSRVMSESRSSAFALRHEMAGLGYQEVITYSFVEDRWERELAGNTNPVRVLNPIAAPLSVMRSSLIGSLVATLQHNLSRRAPRVRLFELGRVFMRDDSAQAGELSVAGLRQPMRLGALAYGPRDNLHWQQDDKNVDFFDVKGDLARLLAPRVACFVPDVHPAMHPGRCARVELDGKAIGHIGELHPKWRQSYELPSAPIVMELDLAAVLQQPVPQARPLPRQQAVLRDLAVIAGEGASHDALVAALMQDEHGLISSAALFDVYKPSAASAKWAAGERSFAFRLTVLDEDATLTDARVDAVVAQAVERLGKLGARLRT